MGSTTMMFYKNEKSIVFIMVLDGHYVLFPFSFNSEITPDDGVEIDFYTKEEAEAWLNKNNYVNVTLKFDTHSIFARHCSYE